MKRRCESKYFVVLLDREGYELGSREAMNLKDAKQEAAVLLDERWATSAETTHESLGTYKVEVRLDSTGECVWDKFYEAQHGSD